MVTPRISNKESKKNDEAIGIKMDWSQVQEIQLDQFPDSQKEEFYPVVAWFDVDTVTLDRIQFVHLFRVTQEVLRFKGEQVETLLAELDEIAEKQGAEEAKVGSERVSSPEYENFRLENSKLKRKLSEYEEQIERFRKDLTKQAREISYLERQKQDLQKELQEVVAQDGNGSETSSDSMHPAARLQYNSMVESLTQKNKHISRLLDNLDLAEKENKILCEKLEGVKQELLEATEHMTQTKDELQGLRLQNHEYIQKIETQEGLIEALRNQIQELIEQKRLHDIRIEEFSQEIDSRVDSWRDLLEAKSKEVLEWKHKCEKAAPLDVRVPELLNKIEVQDEKIQELESQLEEATKEMNETVLKIEQLKAQDDNNKNNKREIKIIQKLEKEVKELEVKLEEMKVGKTMAEEDGKLKGKEVTDLLLQLQKYESGEFGLSEAITQLHDLKRQLTVRDKQISQLIQSLNQLKLEVEHIEEENIILREKAGMEDASPVRVNGIASRHRRQKHLIQKLKDKIAKLEENRLEQKLRIRELHGDGKFEILSQTSQVEIDDGEIKALHDGYLELREQLTRIEANQMVKVEVTPTPPAPVEVQPIHSPEDQSLLIAQLDKLQEENTKLATENTKLSERLEVLTEQVESKSERMELIEEMVILRRKTVFLEETERKLNAEIWKERESQFELKSTFELDLVKLRSALEEKEVEYNLLKEQIRSEMISLQKYRLLEDQLMVLTQKYRLIVEECTNNNVGEMKSVELTEEVLTSETTPNYQSLYAVQSEQLKETQKRLQVLESDLNLVKLKNIEFQNLELKLETQLQHSISEELYRKLEEDLRICCAQYESLKISEQRMQRELEAMEEKVRTWRHWRTVEEGELIALKHMIVNLQAQSDDKVIIAKLGMEVELLKNRVEVKRVSVAVQTNHDLCSGNSKLNDDLVVKNRVLDSIITGLRQQYHGSLPLVSLEVFLKRVRAAQAAKVEATARLEEIQKLELELKIKKEGMEVEVVDDSLVLRELRSRRQLEFKEVQLEQSLMKLEEQEEEILQLEEQLIRTSEYTMVPKKLPVPAPRTLVVTVTNTDSSTQTVNLSMDVEVSTDEVDLNKPELEREISELKTQLEDKASDVLKLEQKVHNLSKDLVMVQEELLTKRSVRELSKQVEVSIQSSPQPQQTEEDFVKLHQDQVQSMKAVIINLQQLLGEKDETIRNYQQILKELKEGHKVTIEQLQGEIQKLQAALGGQKTDVPKLDKITSTPDTALQCVEPSSINQKAIEHYITQVHTLEGHVGELHTAIRVLDTQLTASRQEAVRWRGLADDRLFSMDQLRTKLEEQLQNELMTYRKEIDHWRTEADNLKVELSKKRMEVREEEGYQGKMLREKEKEISELQGKIVDLEKKLSLSLDKSKAELTLENSKKQFRDEVDSLKKQVNSLKIQEKEFREEIRNLRSQLINRPMLSNRSGRSTARETRLQKKISNLEEELDSVRTKLEFEYQKNESRKVKCVEGIALWDKQKRWQQTAEKLKLQLKLKSEELEKLQQSYAMSKNIISRLEREKVTLELRLKSAKGSQILVEDNRLEELDRENRDLLMDLESARSKLEEVNRHSGGLGAKLLQEKLEAQERKIAILELSTKSGVTEEIEKLQSTIAGLQKENLRLEAVNLELKLDLERVGADTPRLRDQVRHLERYVEVLKSERQDTSETRVVELEKTLFVMKRVIEKLRDEAKRGGSSTPRSRRENEEKLKSELYRVREAYKGALDKVAKLEMELKETKKKVLDGEMLPEKLVDGKLEEVKAQLQQKNELLEKVKVLLHRAAVKEKALDEQVRTLKNMLPSQSVIPEEEVPEGLPEELNLKL